MSWILRALQCKGGNRVQKKSNTWAMVLQGLKEKWYFFVILLFLTLIITLLNTLSPLIYKYIIDEAIPNKMTNELILFIGIMVLIPISIMVISLLKDRVVFLLSNYISCSIRYKSFVHSLKMKHEHLSKFGHHRLMMIITREVGKVTELFITSDIVNILSNVIQLIVVFAVVFYFSWQVALICCFIVPILYFIMKLQRAKFSRIHGEHFELLNKGETHLTNSFLGIKTIKSNNGQEIEAEKWNNWLNENSKARWKVRITHSFSRTILPSIVQQLMFGIVFIVCAYLVIIETMSLGSLVAIVSYVPIIFTSISNLLNVQTGYSAIENSLKTLDELFDAEIEEGTEVIGILDTGPLLEFRDVDFSYGRDESNIKVPDLKINRGELITVVGGSGGGKSSIFDLLLRFYEVSQGEILFNGKNIQNLDVNELRKHISFVSQETFLWNTTIQQNIIYPDTEVDPEKYNKCIKLASLTNFVERLPDRDETVIGDFGNQLSGGEKQRIAIARALYSDSEVILLDEPTSALDSMTSKEIFETLIYLKNRNKTVIAITHDVIRSQIADKIVVINGGEIVEFGTPSELKIKQGHFSNLLKTYELESEIQCL